MPIAAPPQSQPAVMRRRVRLTSADSTVTVRRQYSDSRATVRSPCSDSTVTVEVTVRSPCRAQPLTASVLDGRIYFMYSRSTVAVQSQYSRRAVTVHLVLAGAVQS
eukprot:1079896-Prorocentrum_minimum.AAC.1